MVERDAIGGEDRGEVALQEAFGLAAESYELLSHYPGFNGEVVTVDRVWRDTEENQLTEEPVHRCGRLETLQLGYAVVDPPYLLQQLILQDGEGWVHHTRNPRKGKRGLW